MGTYLKRIKMTLNRIKTFALVLLFAGGLAFPLLGKAESKLKIDSSEFMEVRKTFSDCKALRDQTSTRRISLAKVSGNETEVGSWQRSSPRDNETSNSTMIIFISDQKLRAADLDLKAPSGDWQQTTSYCFRSDGTLAFVLSILRTFHGNMRVEDRYYFDQTGKTIRLVRSVFDLFTNKPVDADEGSFMDRKPPIFLSVKVLVEEVGHSNVFQ